MPALSNGNPGVSAVQQVGSVLLELLDEAVLVERAHSIDRELKQSDFKELKARLDVALPATVESAGEDAVGRRHAVVEAAAREEYNRLFAAIPIDSPDFVRVWNLFDILFLLSDNGQCDPELPFLMIEELVEGYTLVHCRESLHYLELRQERITALQPKSRPKLAILRTCNELLRRLSRAEDSALCGRVYIFLFKSFPLGDQSTVNLRGLYHVENVTNYEQPLEDAGAEQMDVDTAINGPPPVADAGDKGASKPTTSSSKADKSYLSPEALYTKFWALQDIFREPKQLFETAKFDAFKSGLEETIKFFTNRKPDATSGATSKDSGRGVKRKRDSEELSATVEAFNPKYLTSKDLFELEVDDLTFRRHVLVQALIVMDFLLSLFAEGKKKIAHLQSTNKGVIADYQLSEEDTKWVTTMKTDIGNCLMMGSDDGRYFCRMVDTVLGRDKNWVGWKISHCPSIECDPGSPHMFAEAKTTAQRLAVSKRLRPTPMGSVSLDFLRTSEEMGDMSDLQAKERYQLPELADFKGKIANDDFEISMPTNDETRAAAVAGKSSKSWRALRIAGRFRLAAFDKIDDPKSIDVVFEEPIEDEDVTAEQEAAAGDEDMPENRAPLVVAGTSEVDVPAVLQNLIDRHKGVFASVARHTTRERGEGEVHGKEFFFVTKQEFSQLRDGDRLIEHGEKDGHGYGTSSKAVDEVVEAGKIPIIALDFEAAQFAKDMDFSARYILLGPPDHEGLAGVKVNELFDTTVAEEDQDKIATTLVSFVFGKEEPAPPPPEANGDAAEVRDGAEVEMKDAETAEEPPPPTEVKPQEEDMPEAASEGTKG